MSDTPLFDATLSDHLQRVRHEADLRVAEAERTVERVRQEARLREAQVAAQTEERVRAELALQAPALPELPSRESIDLDEAPVEREAPPVPSMADLLRPSPGVTRFLDALLGPTE